jgi:hypothetical protein
MSGKYTIFGNVFHSLLPGGVVRSDAGTVINVSSNGTSTIPAQELEKVIFKRFDEMKLIDPSAANPQNRVDGNVLIK